MELEFDKEIDALLRKARHGGASSSPHLDADVIAAFAENALPQRARSRYTMHLADCDRCRKQLSQAVAMQGAVAGVPHAAAVPAAAEVSVPWYKTLFWTPNLAVAMGGLILVFSGVLGFLILQNNLNDARSEISQVADQAPAAPQMSNSANSTANTMAANSSTGLAIPSVNLESTEDIPAEGTTDTAANANVGSMRKEVKAEQPAEAQTTITSRQLSDLPLTMRQAPANTSPPPPSAVSLDGVTAEEAKKDPETRQAERSDESLMAKKKAEDTARARVAPAPRGPVQMQSNQVGNNAGQMAVTRSVGGRKFTNRDGAWYDTAYSGQATTNVRRATDEFKKLDAGLRKIAEELDGVVVVVWKNRAYRIQ